MVAADPVPEIRFRAVALIGKNIGDRPETMEKELVKRMVDLIGRRQHDARVRYALLEVLENITPSTVKVLGRSASQQGFCVAALLSFSVFLAASRGFRGGAAHHDYPAATRTKPNNHHRRHG